MYVNTNGTCSKCSNSIFFNNTCIECTDEKTCTSCINGYSLVNGVCKDCSGLIGC